MYIITIAKCVFIILVFIVRCQSLIFFAFFTEIFCIQVFYNDRLYGNGLLLICCCYVNHINDLFDIRCPIMRLLLQDLTADKF